MQNSLITLDKVTTEWLTSILKKKNKLSGGNVYSYKVNAISNLNGGVYQLLLDYSSDSIGEKPASLIIKIYLGNKENFGISEYYYYARDYLDLDDSPVPFCYDAGYSQKGYHILMEDLLNTHHNNYENKNPTIEYGTAVAEALATLHAKYWGPEKLKTIDASIPSKQYIENYLNHLGPGLIPLLKEMGDELSPEWKNILTTVIDSQFKVMLNRIQNPEGFTIVHGDVNPGNILSPNTKERPVYLIDRQPFDWSLTTWLGVSDLSFLMVHVWNTELRRKFEKPILKSYLNMLEQKGIYTYSWNQLIYDYRMSAVESIFLALSRCADDQDIETLKWLWPNQLKKALIAYEDLHCDELPKMLL